MTTPQDKAEYPFFCLDCGKYICDLEDTKCPKLIKNRLRRSKRKESILLMIYANLHPRCDTCEQGIKKTLRMDKTSIKIRLAQTIKWFRQKHKEGIDGISIDSLELDKIKKKGVK